MLSHTRPVAIWRVVEGRTATTAQACHITRIHWLIFPLEDNYPPILLIDQSNAVRLNRDRQGGDRRRHKRERDVTRRSTYRASSESKSTRISPPQQQIIYTVKRYRICIPSTTHGSGTYQAEPLEVVSTRMFPHKFVEPVQPRRPVFAPNQQGCQSHDGRQDGHRLHPVTTPTRTVVRYTPKPALVGSPRDCRSFARVNLNNTRVLLCWRRWHLFNRTVRIVCDKTKYYP